MRYFGSFDELTTKTINIKDRIKADIISCGDNSITLKFPKQEVDYTSAVAFALLDSHNRYVWYSTCNINSSRHTVNFDGFDYTSIDEVPLRFKLYIVFENNGVLNFSRLYSKSVKEEYRSTRNKRILYLKAVSKAEMSGEKVSLITNITTSGYLGFILIEQKSFVDYIVDNTVEDFGVKGRNFTFDVKIEKLANCSDLGVTLKTSLESDSCYDIAPDEIKDMEDSYILKYTLSRDFLKDKEPCVLNIYAYYQIKGFRYYTTVKIANDPLVQKITQVAEEDNISGKGLDEITVSVAHNKRVRFSSVITHKGTKITIEDNQRRILFSPDFLPKCKIFGEHYVDNNGSYRVLLYPDMREVGDISVFLHCPSRREKIVLDVVSFDRKKGEITVDFSSMKNSVEDFVERIYNLCVAFSYKGNMYSVNVMSPDYEVPKDGREECLKSVATFNVKDTVVIMEPMCDKTGSFCIRLRDRLVSHRENVSVKYRSVHFKKNFLYITSDVTDNMERFTGYALSYRYKQCEDKRIYYAKGDLVASGDKTLLKARFDLSAIELQSVIWDLYAVYVEDGATYFASVAVDNSQVNSYLFSFKNIFDQNHYRFVSGDNKVNLFFPYFTMENTLSFIMRSKQDYDSKKFRLKELLALAIFKLRKSHYTKKRIALVYEKNSNYAQDNGYYFFAHCMRHKIQRRLNANIFYVIQKDSKDYSNLEKYSKNVLEFMSLKHMVYALASRLLISTESRSNCYIWRPNNSPIARSIRDKKLFSLRHGVTGLKRIGGIYNRTNPHHPSMIVASSDGEKEILLKNLNYSSNEVCVTGLARWDALEDKSKDSKEILFVPAMRSWLEDVDDETFLESDYYTSYIQLLRSEGLEDILEKNDLTLDFFVNNKLRDYISKFSVGNKRINILTEDDVQLNSLIMRCKALITDYSSVCWDVLYLNKPVLFYQFDYEKYKNTTGSYIDMERDLPGDRSTSVNVLCNDLQRLISSDYRISYKYQLKRELSFKYFDTSNCVRLVQEIRKMKW
ncbi:MAG: CDP-glycerol glycerophosphotransferase family protein [Ruminococcus sp.]